MFSRSLIAASALLCAAWSASVHAGPPSLLDGEVEVTGSVDIESLPPAFVERIDELVAAIAVRKIPVKCSGFAREGERDRTAARLTCRVRGLQETSFTEVPEGKFVALTDVVISATNIAAVDQRYNLSIGAGTIFGPGNSGGRFIGTTDAGSRSHFTTPFVIATKGQSILVNNFSRPDFPGSVGMDANVNVFGYIADIDAFGF